MPVNSPSGRIATNLVQQAAQGADVAQIADAVIAAWAAVDAALAPIIGSSSVVVLYTRSRHVAARVYPWLQPNRAPIQLDLPALRSLLVQQDTATAAAGGGAQLQAFCELLASLVGPSLTSRLLDSVWTSSSSSGLAAQDPTP